MKLFAKSFSILWDVKQDASDAVHKGISHRKPVCDCINDCSIPFISQERVCHCADTALKDHGFPHPVPQDQHKGYRDELGRGWSF